MYLDVALLLFLVLFYYYYYFGAVNQLGTWCTSFITSCLPLHAFCCVVPWFHVLLLVDVLYMYFHYY